MLAVPYAIAEPAKLYGMFLVGRGHFVLGGAIVASAYLAILLLVETIYQGARSKLRSIAWFAALVDWASAIRDSVSEPIRSSRAYQTISSFRH